MIKLSKKLRERFRIQKNKFFVGPKKDILNTRPELDHVYEDPNGHLVISNTYVLARAKNVLENPEPNDELEYPDTEHLFEDLIDHQAKIKLSAKDVENLLKPKEIRDQTDILKLDCSFDQINFSFRMMNGDLPDIQPFTIHGDFDVNSTKSIMMNPKNLYEAMNFYRMLGLDEVDLYITASNKPFKLVHKNIEYLISPIV